MNRLYYGDCLTVMQSFPLASVDLIYLDPPFSSNRDYNAIYTDETGRQLPDQIEAFCDTWTLDAERERAIKNMPVLMRESGIEDSVVEFWRIWMNALRNTQPRLLAYLSYMVERLLPMRAILKPTGSIYLHCDPTAGHYIKVMMDGIFGHDNFRNEITWQRTESHNTADRFGNVADTILYYAASSEATWNPQFQPYSKAQLDRHRHKDEDGRPYRLDDLTAPRPNSDSGKFEWRGTMPGKTRGWGYRLEQLEKWWAEGRIKTKRDGTPRMDGLVRYLDESPGAAVQNIWTDIPRIPNTSPERMGYDTQKPVKLLRRIISASTNEGDVVMDPFCGCASTLEAAHSLDRRWIGIDIAIHAIKRVAKVRLQERLGLVEGEDFTVEGVPRNVEGAHDLWERDKYHFQKWAVEQVDGFVTTRRTSDGGVDGRLYFARYGRKELSSMALEVKGGKNVNISTIRELRGVLERDEAELAGLIVLHEITGRKLTNFKREMAQAGTLNEIGVEYPRLQILTVDQILDGEQFETPSPVGRGERQPALPGTARRRKHEPEQLNLLDVDLSP